MIIFHEAEREDRQGKVKGYIVKMWGRHHIIQDGDENVAYPVIEESITPCLVEGAKRECVRCMDQVEEERFENGSSICIDCKYEMREVMELLDSKN